MIKLVIHCCDSLFQLIVNAVYLMHVCIDTQHIGGMMQLVRSLVFKMDIYIYDAGIYIVDALQIKAGRHHISLTPPMANRL